MKPNSIPVVIEYDNGIITITIKAGTAKTTFLKLMLLIASIIDKPIRINTGAIAAIGTQPIIGANNNDNPKMLFLNFYNHLLLKQLHPLSNNFYY